MRKILLIFAFVLSISHTCFAQFNTSESLTITTYYPAPYGVYRNLRLHPSQMPNTGVDSGVMYFNQSENITYVYMNDTLGWQPSAGIWKKTGNEISNLNSANVNVSGGLTVGYTTATVPGTIRFNSGSSAFEGYYNGGWNPLFGINGSGGNSTGCNATDCSQPLFNYNHIQSACTSLGGTVYHASPGDPGMCRFNAASCPSGWIRYNSWSTTVPKTCSWGVVDTCAPTYPNDCTTPSHSWSNKAPYDDRCHYWHYTTSSVGTHCADAICFATITQIGCY